MRSKFSGFVRLLQRASLRSEQRVVTAHSRKTMLSPSDTGTMKRRYESRIATYGCWPSARSLSQGGEHTLKASQIQREGWPLPAARRFLCLSAVGTATRGVPSNHRSPARDSSTPTRALNLWKRCFLATHPLPLKPNMLASNAETSVATPVADGRCLEHRLEKPSSHELPWNAVARRSPFC